MNRWSALAALLLAFAAALALRLSDLSARPLHNDEAVNATKVAELYQHDFEGHAVVFSVVEGTEVRVSDTAAPSPLILKKREARLEG